MLPLPKLMELQANLEYIKNLNHSFAVRYLQGQPNASAKNEAAALQTAITNLISNRRDDLDTWAKQLKEITDSLSASRANPYGDEVTEKLLSDISAYKDDIVANDISGKLTAFLIADDYRQLSDPKIKDSNGDPVQKDLIYVTSLVDDVAMFEQTHSLLYSNPALDSFTEKLDEYRDQENSMLLQQQLIMITAPAGIDAGHIDDEVSALESELKQCNDSVNELAGRRKEYNEKYLAAFEKLKNASEEDKKALGEEVDFYSSEGFREQMIDRTINVLNAELSLKQKTHEKEMFNASFATFNRLTDMRNEIAAINAGYTDPEDFLAGRVSKKVSFFLTESDKNKGAFLSNDAKFTKIQEDLKALGDASGFSGNPDELKKRLETLKAAASEFIEEHKNDKNPLNSKTRHFRLNLSGRISAYCEKTVRSIDKVTWTRTAAIDQYVKHILEHPENAITSAEYSGMIRPQQEIIDRTTEKIDSLKHHIESLLMTEESMSRTGLETHSAYKASVFRSVFYLEVIDELDKRSFDIAPKDLHDIDRILAYIRDLLDTPDAGVKILSDDPDKAYIFKPFDHIESNNMHNNFDFFDEFKTTANISTAIEAHKIDTKLNRDFHQELYIDRKILAEYLEKKK